MQKVNPRNAPKQLNFTVNCPEFTTSTGLSLFIGILDMVLQQKNQTPFLYPVLRERVAQKLNENPTNWKITTTLDVARRTLDQIKDVRMRIEQEIRNLDVSTFLIGIGPTIFTMKEAIFVHLPPMSRITDDEPSKRFFMNFMQQLCTSAFMEGTTEHRPTNTFVMFQAAREVAECEVIPNLHIPSRCRTTYINVNGDDQPPNRTLNWMLLPTHIKGFKSKGII